VELDDDCDHNYLARRATPSHTAKKPPAHHVTSY